MNNPSKGYLKIESESCFFPKKAVIILAMTVFPKRLGRVMHIWVLPESKNGNNSDSICDLSTKYGCSVCPLYKTYEVELFRYLPMIFPPIYAKIKPFCSFSISISKSLL